MKEITKVLKKYLHVIILMIIIIGFISNKDKVVDIFDFIMGVLSPMLLGIFLAYLLNPLVFRISSKLKFKKNGIKKVISITITYILFIGFLVLVGMSCIPKIVSNISELISKAPKFYDNCIKLIEDNKIGFFEGNDDVIKNTISQISSYLTNILPNVIEWVSGVFKGSFNFLVAIVLSIYLLIEKDNLLRNIKRFGKAYFSEKTYKKISEVYIDCEYIFNKYIIGKAIDSAIIGCLCFVTMLVFKLDYALLISFLVGLTNMVPYVGPFVGGAIGVILLLILSPSDAFIFLIIVLVIQQLDGWVIGPKILGGKVGVKPIWIIISIIIGGALGGFIGMFFGTPVVAIISYLLDKDINKRLEMKENQKEKLEE